MSGGDPAAEGYEHVGPFGQFGATRPKIVEACGRKIAVFRRGDTLHAIQDYCPHMGASLAMGRLDGDHVVCAWHDWRWHVDDGGCGRPSGISARTYDVLVVDGEVWLRQRPHPDDAPAKVDDEDEWVEWSDDFLKSSKQGED